MTGRSRRLAALERNVAALERPGPERPRGPAPWPGTFLDFLAAAELDGPSWQAWATFWKAVDHVPLSPAELEVFRAHTGRQLPPASPVREAWLVCGRRSGKSRMMAARAAWTAIRRDWRQALSRGETAIIPLIAADRTQATVALHYLRGLFELPAFAPFVGRVLMEEVALRTGCTIAVRTCSYKSVRGITCPCVLGDEVSFWASDDGAASPDGEVLTALRPTMSTIPDGLLLGGSTPYARSGMVWRMFERHFGKDDATVLVWNADVASMNPTIDPQLVSAAFADDALSAASEYGQEGRVSFRTDVEQFLSLEVVTAATVAGRYELAPWPTRDRDPRRGPPPVYAAFCDPSGGSSDSMTLAVAHLEGDHAVLDVVRETRPPFSPDACVEQFAQVLRSYGLSLVDGDFYGGLWPTEAFSRHGITYRRSAKPKSTIYLEALPLLNANRVELLDLPRLRVQLLQLERKTSRGGKDSVDHGAGQHDDLCNAALGALLLAAGRASELPGGFWFNW